MNLINGDIFIWGTAARGRQIRQILDSDGVHIKGFVDSKDKNAMNPTDFLAQSTDETIVIIATIKPEIAEEIMGFIKDNNFKGRTITSYEFHHEYEVPYFEKNSKREYDIDFFPKMQVWFDNFLSEVSFWKNECATPGSYYWNHYCNRIQPKEFKCEHLKAEIKENDVILDVGCGICSQYGNTVGNKKLQLIGIDPLAPFYNEINAGIDQTLCSEKPSVRFGMFELLSYMMGENYADIILVDNALDHCIDPYAAIIECLKVLKHGGVLSTAHHIDEAYKAFYSDLHQWNICADQKNHFILWNKDNYIDVSDELAEYAEIRTYMLNTQTIEQPYGSVVCNIKKKKDIPDDIYSSAKERCGFVIEEMMNKLSDRKHAAKLLNI